MKNMASAPTAESDIFRSIRPKEVPFFAAAVGRNQLEPPYVGCYNLKEVSTTMKKHA